MTQSILSGPPRIGRDRESAFNRFFPAVRARGTGGRGAKQIRTVIAQISDTHILSRSSDEPAGARRADDLRRCVADINRQGVDVVVHTGDGVHHGRAEEYAYLREILAGLNMPCFMVPGNRDRREALRAAFNDHPHMPANGSFFHYAVDDFSVRLLALDSVGAGDRKGVFCEERLAWLEATLAREPDRPTLLFMHHPPFDIGDHYIGGYRRPREAEDLATVVGRHSQVALLICGHVHCLHRASWGGTVAATMPSVAVDLRRDVDPAIGTAPMYVLHVATDDGRVESHVRVVTD